MLWPFPQLITKLRGRHRFPQYFAACVRREGYYIRRESVVSPRSNLALNLLVAHVEMRKKPARGGTTALRFPLNGVGIIGRRA
jgi:hypothetical protein